MKFILQRIDYNPTVIFKEVVGIATSFKPRSPALSFGLDLVKTVHMRIKSFRLFAIHS